MYNYGLDLISKVMVLTKRHFRVCAFSRSSASFKWKDKLHCSKRSRWKKRKKWRNRLIADNVNTVFLNLPGSHRDMMRVAEIIVAFVFSFDTEGRFAA